MKSKISIAGHPLHPLLVALPIGLFVWTLVSDIIYLATNHVHMWYDLAFWTGIAAIVTALVAALPGFGDYVTMAVQSDARTIATAHMLLNLSVVALFFVAMLLMLNDGATAGTRLTAVVLLHLIGVGALTVSGWLGGEMVFRHHLAMVPDDAQAEQAEQQQHGLGIRQIRP
jgi:uncharacterized membrane protein